MNILNRQRAGSVKPEIELNCKKSYFFANPSIAIEPLLFSAPLASWR
jgi:hypothetical protein